MSNIDIALEATSFMEAHLTEDISVSDVAGAVSLSLFHFSRVFSGTTRHSPYDYLMRRRLCEAAGRLVETDEKIIDIALAYRFNAPETFSRAFRRMFGLQPRQARSGTRIDQRRLMPPPTRDYLGFLNGSVSLIPTERRLSEMHAVGVADQILACDAGKQSRPLWAALDRQLEASTLSTEGRAFYGILLYDASRWTERCTYLAGTVLHEGEEPPSSLLEKHLPAAVFACFERPDCRAMERHTRAYVYHTWWPKMTTSPPGMIEVECRPVDAGSGSALSISAGPGAICVPLPTALTMPNAAD